jgi:Uncharacterized protein conserved in bacteria
MVELKDCLAQVERDLDREATIAFSAAQRNIAERAEYLAPATLARFAAAADRAQAAWRAFVDVDCRETVGFEWWGGSGAGAAIRACVIDATAQRVRSLVARYDLRPEDFPLAHREGG